MSIISEIQQKADFQATIKAFIALFMDFNRPWQAGHFCNFPQRTDYDFEELEKKLIKN